MVSLQEYKGEQLTKEEIDLLELYDTIRKQQAAVRLSAALRLVRRVACGG